MSFLQNFSNLQLRVATGVLGAAVFAGMLFIGAEGCFLLFSLLVFFCNREFLSISPVPFNTIQKNIWSALGCLGFTFLYLAEVYEIPAFPRIIILPFLVVAASVFSADEKPFEKNAWVLFGWIYLSLPWYCLLKMLAGNPYNPMLMLGIFGLLWIADSGAYFAGRFFGRTKLMPSVSPKKTWEGLGGGLLASLLLAWFLSGFQTEFSETQWLILAASTTLAGTLGDLAESRLKRSLDLKDSGNILPGHGGFLDRFDGFFLASPVNYLIAAWFF
jgi:phosphatidate cytidylyltransferase